MNGTTTRDGARTGIIGLDEALGGLPRRRTTLVVGSPGAGKTLLAVRTLVEGTRLGEPGVFLSLEESPKDVLANIAGFPWAPSRALRARLSFMDGRDLRTALRNGAFDLIGLLSALEHRCRRLKARRLAIDGLDVVLDMIDDPAVMRREVYRLADWLSGRGLTAVITAKSQPQEEVARSRYAFLPFLTDCVLLLEHRVVGRTAVRGLQILKCRGVAHSSNEMPMVLSSAGLEVASPPPAEMRHRVFSDRVSTGVVRLDTMLTGGYLRGTCTLISGAPGTSKTSLAGAFTEAACARSERTLFVSFDEADDAIVRNLASVNVRLRRFVRSGHLRIFSVPARGTTPEAHALRIRSLLEEHRARCLVIDPVSALVHTGASDIAADAVLGLLDFAKGRGVTAVLTSLLDGSDPAREGTAVGISTVADTWMHLSYLVAAGERNRALTIVKSRGTGHSNQVRELVLSDRGLSLVDVYTAGGAVLMGTLRWEKEEHERAEHDRLVRAEAARRLATAEAVSEIETRLAGLRAELEGKKAELRSLKDGAKAGVAVEAANAAALRILRRGDPEPRPSSRPRR